MKIMSQKVQNKIQNMQYTPNKILVNSKNINSISVLPFLLVQQSGNPKIVYYYRDLDSESFYIMMARAEDTMNDIFLTGGDANKQAFLAWKRIE